MSDSQFWHKPRTGPKTPLFNRSLLIMSGPAQIIFGHSDRTDVSPGNLSAL
jgi:hypothetical protein